VETLVQITAYIALALAAALTALFLPMVHSIGNLNGPDSAGAGIGVFLLSLVRGAVLIGGLLMLAGVGRLDGLAATRGAQVGLVFVGVVLMEMVCCGFHLLSIDRQVSQPFPVIFGLLATVLPVMLLVSGVLGSLGAGGVRILYLAGVGLSVVSAAGAYFSYDALTAAHREQRDKEVAAAAALLAAREEAWEKLPQNADLQQVLAFSGAGEPAEIRTRVQQRLKEMPGSREALGGMLGGDSGLLAVYALREQLAEAPEELLERAWETTGRFSGELSGRVKAGGKVSGEDWQMLHDAARALAEANKPLKDKHQKELVAARDSIRLGVESGTATSGTAWLDMYIVPGN